MDRAVRAASDILGDYQHRVSSLTLVTGSKGVFEVAVDGETIYSKAAEGRHADAGEVLERFRGRFGDGVPTYGS